MTSELDAALQEIPCGLREPLVRLYEEALAEYRAGRWEAVGTKAGKICEVAYSILDGNISGTYPAKPSKPKNMVAGCTAMEQHNKVHGRSVCIQIPRILIAVYELRNNRDIGHIGSDVSPNEMDAEFFLRAIKWIVAELVRVYSNQSVEEARALVEVVTQRSYASVWEHGDIKRVLNPSFSAKNKILLLLYTARGPVPVQQLVAWSEYTNASRLRSDVLRGLHEMALIHFDRQRDEVHLLPTGLKKVELELL